MAYTREFKLKVLMEAQHCKDTEICARYGIASTKTLRNWRKQLGITKELEDLSPVTPVSVVSTSEVVTETEITSLKDRKESVLSCVNESLEYLRSAIAYHQERENYDSREILAITNAFKLMVELAVLLE